MTTTHQKPIARGRIAAAAMLAVSGALVAGALGAAAPANANQEFYVALAYQTPYWFEGRQVYGEAHGIGRSSGFDSARIDAINDCERNGGLTGGGQCSVRIVATNECAAVAVRATGFPPQYAVETATHFNQQQAEQLALANTGGGKVAVSGCPNYNGGPRVQPPVQGIPLPPAGETRGD